MALLYMEVIINESAHLFIEISIDLYDPVFVYWNSRYVWTCACVDWMIYWSMEVLTYYGGIMYLANDVLIDGVLTLCKELSIRV